MNSLLDNRIYYAQNREDLILESFFGDVENGFYVDVGACHPHVASVTKRFYLKGWKGINIEPQINLHALFTIERKRDINLNVGVSDKNTTVMLRTYIHNQGLSTMAPDIKDTYEGVEGNRTENYEDISIKVTTLEVILRQHKVKSIQFLKVDVEGYEYEVLNGNDWSQFRPEVICIEADHIIKDWRPLLRKNGYDKVFFDGLNEYYVDSKTDRAKHFNFINHVLLDLKGGIAADDYEKLSSFEKENVDHNKLIEELKSSLDSKSKELISIKRLVKRVFRLSLARTKKMLK